MLLGLKFKGGTAPLIIERVMLDQVLFRIDRAGNGVGTQIERGARTLVATLVPSGESCVITVDPDVRFSLVRAIRAKPVRPE